MGRRIGDDRVSQYPQAGDFDFHHVARSHVDEAGNLERAVLPLKVQALGVLRPGGQYA